MSSAKVRPLNTGYRAQVDSIDERSWYDILPFFEDANLYQTWAYADVICGRRNMSHLVLRFHDQIAAIAQARITKLPWINSGIAYVHWGPLWRRHGISSDPEVFRQAIRALRNEFVCRRGLGLRIFPTLFDDQSASLSNALVEEGFFVSGKRAGSRTILMNLAPSLEDLRNGMRPHWKRELKVAEHHALEVIEGCDLQLFHGFIQIYREMVARKKFVEPNNINQFVKIQARLPQQFKMKIMLCRWEKALCAGQISSSLGNSALYLFGATSNAGMKSRGSYLLQWKLIQQLKQSGIAVYDLNGINPEKNPGTYKFKSDLAGSNGKDVCFLGRFDAQAGAVSRWPVACGEALRGLAHNFKEWTHAAPGKRLWPKAVN